MKIIIEAGATKSTCIGYRGGTAVFTYKTSGINATYASKEAIEAVFQDIIEKNDVVADEVQKIRYYGAGCFNTVHSEKVKEALLAMFPNAEADVFSDLLAACHALCKNREGFVAILGTGSASCLYNGEQIIDQAPSLGYLLGDEGSGTYIGKQFVKKYLTGKLDPIIAQDFEETFAVNKERIFEIVYREPNPQIFFASLPVFMHKHVENPQIAKLVSNAFYSFFTLQKKYYKNSQHPWYFCGSIAYYFQDILMKVAGTINVTIRGIVPESAELLHF